MGNSSSDIISRVESLDLEALSKSIKSDLEISNDLRLIFNNSKLNSRLDLDNYIVPGYSAWKKDPEEARTGQEETMIYSLDCPENFKKKHEGAIKNLIQEIDKNRPDNEIFNPKILKLQSICRTFEGLLKLDKFKRLKKSEKYQEAPINTPDFSFVTEIYQSNPSIAQEFSKYISKASNLQPQPTNQDIFKNLDIISSFLQAVLNREIQGVEENDIIQSISALFALAIGTEDLNSALGLAINFLKIDQSALSKEKLEIIWKNLKEFKKLKATLIQEPCKWKTLKDPSQPNFVFEEGMLIMNTKIYNDDEKEKWPFVLGEKEFTSGIHYFEFLVEDMQGHKCFIGVSDSNYENENHQKICFSSKSIISINNNEVYEWEKFKKDDRIGILLNMNDKTVTFFKNGEKEPQGNHGPLPEAVKLFVTLISPIKLRSFEITQYPQYVIDMLDLDKAHENSEIRDENAYKLLENEEVSDDWFSISPTEIAVFIINKLACINTDILTLHEKHDLSTNISKRKDLTLDYQFLTLNQLDSLLDAFIDGFKSGNYERLTAESYLQAISSTIQLIRTQILASNYHQDTEIGDEIRQKIMKHLKLILSIIPNSKSSEEAIETLSLGFEFFYENPKERLTCLITCLKQKYRSDLQDEAAKRLNDCIISNISSTDQLLTFFESKTEEEFIEISQFLDLLLDLGSEASTSTLLEFQSSDKSIIHLIEMSQAALLTVAAKSNSQEWLMILSKYSKKLLEISTKLIISLLEKYPAGDLQDEIHSNINNTILGYPLEELLYSLPLIKIDLSCSIQILEALQSYLIKANSLKPKPPLLLNTIKSKIIIYESKHPHESHTKTTKMIKVPNATKYVLTFDPRSCTAGYDAFLTLRIGDERNDCVFQSRDSGFPDITFEVNNPFLIFDFESDVSSCAWGWKVDIKAICKEDTYAKRWPESTKEAAEILLENMCRSFIAGKWDLRGENEEIVKLLDNPLIRYGINEGVLLLAENVIRKDFKTLARITSFNEEKYSDKFMKKTPEAASLENYMLSSEEKRFNYPSFLQELIEGSERVKAKWEILKEKSDFVGQSTIIGGEEMDQAERAIFAVYITYFEVIDTVSNIFDESGELGETLKYFIKNANLIRGWAQKHKQNLMENENSDITYVDISNDIVKKCKLLLGSDYKLALNEIGVNIAIKNLLQNPSKDNETENEDIKEFIKVFNYVTKFLETSIKAEIIIKTIEERKCKAITRSAGFQLLFSMISSSSEHEISLIKVFSDSLKVNGEKRHYWEGLEGVDPKLLHIVKSSFFQVYNLLLKKFTKPQPKILLPSDIYYYLYLLDAISYPFKWIDSLSILNLPIFLSQLLKFSKGFINLEELQRRFKKECCITKVEISSNQERSNNINRYWLSYSNETAFYLNVFEDPSLKSIIDVVISPEEAKEGYEKVEGFCIDNEEKKYVYIKRGEEKQGEKFFVYKNGVSFQYLTYDELCDFEVDAENKSRVELKMKICRISWYLFKQLCYSIAGNWVEPNKKNLILDGFMQVIFNDLKCGKNLINLGSESFDIKKIINGDEWVGKKIESLNIAKNPVHEWLSQFKMETERFENFALRDLINEYIEKIDPSMKGVLTQEDLEYLDPEIIENLQRFEDNKNCNGYYDFFKYLGNLRKSSHEFPENIQGYLSSSILWKHLPYDFYDAQKFYDVTDVKTVVENFALRLRAAEGELFMKYIELFRISNHPGIISQDNVPENTPSEFKDHAGNIDFYLLIKTINSNPEKFADLYNEIQDSLTMYNEWPSSCRGISEVGTENIEYISSLLWVIYGCHSSKCLPKLLIRDSYIKSLFELTLGFSSEKIITFGARILRYAIENQQSSDTTFHWFDEIFNSILGQKVDYITLILSKIGEGFNWRENENIKACKYRLAHEGKSLLLSLFEIERWRKHVIISILDTLNNASISIRNGEIINSKAIGAISFLASLSKNFDGFGEDPIMLSNAKLSHISLPKSVIKEIKGSTATLYNISEDFSINEALDKLERIDYQHILNIFEVLSTEEKNPLSLSLISLWENFQNYENRLDLSDFDKNYAYYRCLYKSLENSILGTIVDILESKELNMEIAMKITERILRKNNLENKSINNNMYSNILKEIAKKINTAPIENKVEIVELTEENAQERFFSLSGDDKALATELLWLDIPTFKIIKFFDAGIKNKNRIINCQEPQKAEKEPLYKLIQTNSLIAKGNNKSSAIYQDEYDNLTIRRLSENLNEKSEIGIQLDGSIFHNLQVEIDSITILAYIEYKPADDFVNCGIKIGDLELGVNKTDEFYFTINGETTKKLNEPEKLFVRVHAKARGQNYITVEDHTFETINLSVFNGIKVGNFGIYLEKGKIITLLGLEIYSDLYKGPLNTETMKPKELEGGEQTVRVFNKLSSTAQEQLSLIGQTENFQYNSEGNIDLISSIDYAMENFEADNFKTLSLNNDKTVIEDVKIFDSKDKVPEDYKIVQVYSDEFPIDFDFDNIKVLAIRKGIPIKRYTSDITIENRLEDFEKIGNLSKDTNRACNIYQKLSWNLPPIKDIAIFKVTDIYNVKIPIGFELICGKDSKAINIAPSSQKSYYLFIGIKRNNFIMNCSVFSSLSSIDSISSSFGLTNEFTGINISANKEEYQKIYGTYSFLELYNSLYDLEEIRNFIASKKLLLIILKNNPTLLAYPEMLNKTITYIGSDYIQLESSLLSLLKNSEVFRKSSIKEFILQSIFTLIQSNPPSEFPIWLLEKFLEAKADLSVLFSLRVIQPLFLRFLSSFTNSSEKFRALAILKSLIKVQNYNNYQIIRYLMSEATELYNKCKITKKTHPILLPLISLLSESSKILSHISLDNWITDLNKQEKYIKGLAEIGEGLTMMICESYKSSFEQAASLVYESSHPYERQTKAEKIYIPQAKSLTIEFDKKSVVEVTDNIYFSYDSEGKNQAGFVTGSVDCIFSESYKDPYIEIINNGKTAVMKMPKAWANILLNLTITKGKYKITYKIDNQGDNYFILGFIKEKDYNKLAEKNKKSKLFGISPWWWESWNTFSDGGKDYRCKDKYKYMWTNDLISFLIDTQKQKIICYKNGVKVHKFTGVTDSVIPIISFQDKNDSISIEKVELFDALELSGKKVEIKGDTAYFWHPANIGCLINHEWSKNLGVKISDSYRTITKIENNFSVHATPYVLKYGKHYIESQINSEGRIGLGFATNSSIEAKNAEYSPLIVFSDTEGFTIDDIIGSYIDFEKNECKFFKNGELISSKELPVLEGYQYIAVFYSSNQSITILKNPSTPAEIDIINIHSEISSTLWGYKLKVTPQFDIKIAQDIDNLLNFTSEEIKTLWNENLPKFIEIFKSEIAEQFVAYLDEMTQYKGLNIMKLKDENIDPSKYELFYYPALKALNKENMRQLYKILQIFNKKIRKSLWLFDIHIESYETSTSLQKSILACKNYIFFKIKNDLFNINLIKSEKTNRKSFIVDKLEIDKHRDYKDIDILGRFSLFGQIYRNTISWPNEDFRNSDNFCKVDYNMGRYIHDYTLHYETIASICEELQSFSLRLLIKSPNSEEFWIVNPTANNEQDIELFEFLGKLMGTAIITENKLKISFLPFFWKRLVIDKLTIKDLKNIDICAIKTIEILRNPENNQLNPDIKFTTKDSSGREIELIEGGKEIQVTYENAGKYADLIEKYRLNENQKAYNAIRKGLSAVIPIDLLTLFSWKYVESLVYGETNVDVRILKNNTDYKDCSLENQHIISFWEILTEMMPKERILFLKFVWGRSKLPSGNDWKHMTICRYDTPGIVDDYLPISHTCEFTLDLPAYTAKEVMRNKLLYAITHYIDSDLDISAGLKEEN